MSGFSLILFQAFVDSFVPIVATVVGGILVNRVSRWTGVEIEARHREALQSALTNGALFAIAKYEPGAGAAAIGMATDYVRQSVPDAIKRFDLDEASLTRLVIPKIREQLTKARP